MIRTRKELKEYILADRKALKMKHPFWARITYGEHARIRTYLFVMRHAEYWESQKTFFGKFCFAIYFLWYRRLCLKYNMYISLNTLGKGVCIEHPGFVRVDTFCQVGEKCTILPNVLLGKKSPGIDGRIMIGNNCYIGTGVTILGPVTIGDNVTIAAGAVVLHDVPNQAVVAGVPAKVVKYNSGGVSNLIFSRMHKYCA